MEAAERTDALSWQALGRAVRERREALTLHQQDAARAADIAPATWRRIEYGSRATGVTLRRVEMALHWQEGTVSRLLAGETLTRDESVIPTVPASVTAYRPARGEDLVPLMVMMPADLIGALAPEDLARVSSFAQRAAEEMARALLPS